MEVLLYDYQRDKDLKVGEAILVFEDGKTRRVRESSLFQKEDRGVREPNIKRASGVRSRTARNFKRGVKRAKSTTPTKRLPIYQA